jgi:hypothetical protein
MGKTQLHTTNHGERRIRKRLGIKKKTVNRIRDSAFTKGIKHKQATGRLRNYFTWLYLKYKSSNNIRIYANYVWIFHNEYLITVFPVPKEHRKAAIKILNKEGVNYGECRKKPKKKKSTR